MEYPIHVTFRCEAEIERRIRIEAAKRDMNRTEFIVAAIVEKLEQIDAQSPQDTAESNT